jgi:hypothetical protein
MNRSDMLDKFSVLVSQTPSNRKCYNGFSSDNTVTGKNARIGALGSQSESQLLEPYANRNVASAQLQLRDPSDNRHRNLQGRCLPNIVSNRNSSAVLRQLRNRRHVLIDRSCYSHECC